MNILIVGNVIKDVYLNLDSRTDNYESDKNGTPWLDISFNASEHHFFHRSSNFGGAAVSQEVFSKLGLSSLITNSDYTFESSSTSTPPETYRYILVSDGGVSYLTSSNDPETVFVAPTEQPDFIFIDRSAVIGKQLVSDINDYLSNHSSTKLILYISPKNKAQITPLIPKSSLVFAEKDTLSSEEPYAPESTVYLCESTISFRNITEKITRDRIDRFTHLSAFSIVSATILSCFIKGESIEHSLQSARLNVENSTINATLSKEELTTLLSNYTEDNLELIAATLMYSGKGILAADESGGSIQKKFANLSIPDTFENRHEYRNIFFSTPNINRYLNGIILFDETARDHMDNGEAIPEFLTDNLIIPGIKVDQGLEPLNDTESYTKGLDGLKTRLREYYQMGLRFAKWRAAFNITLSPDGIILTPSNEAINENCRILAEYALDCQSAGLVPIVEPEVVYDGKYEISDCAAATSKILDQLFATLKDFNVNLKACILKTNMVLAGKQNEAQSTPEEVGIATAKVLKSHVPPELAGIVFLSGGQTPEQATDNLQAIIKNGPFPWPITFSYARAIQDPALYAWKGNSENIDTAKKAFEERLIANTNALKD